MAKTLSLSEAKAKLSALVEDIEQRDEEVVITRNGRPAAVGQTSQRAARRVVEPANRQIPSHLPHCTEPSPGARSLWASRADLRGNAATHQVIEPARCALPSH